MKLEDKIKYSIELIKKNEKLALKYSAKGYAVAFSGGKDSQVVEKLCEMAGVKYQLYFNVSTVDPGILLKFVRKNYPKTIFLRPKMSMFELIIKKKFLPFRHIRYCCEYFKEHSTPNRVTILGLRKEESQKRKNRKVYEFNCYKGNDEIILCPILEWTWNDVWNFIHNNKMEYCSLYDIPKIKRIGCIGCPMASKNTRYIEFRMFPVFEKHYKKSIKKLIEMGMYKDFTDESDVFEWWISALSKEKHLANKKQLKIPY